jgi:hypothetical protein
MAKEITREIYLLTFMVMSHVTNFDKQYFIEMLIVPHLVNEFPEFHFAGR